MNRYDQYAKSPDPERDARFAEEEAARAERRFKTLTYTDGESYTNPAAAAPYIPGPQSGAFIDGHFYDDGEPPAVHMPDKILPTATDPPNLPDYTHHTPAPTIPAPASEKCRMILSNGRMCRNTAAVGQSTTRPRCATHAAEINAAQSPYVRCQPVPEVATIGPGLHVPTKPDPYAIACPQCHAGPHVRCTNYAGKNCATHSQRKAKAQARKIPMHHTPTAPDPGPPDLSAAAWTHPPAARPASQPADPKEDAALDRAFPGRVAARVEIHRQLAAEYFPAPQPAPPPLTPAQLLAAAVEALVAQHGCGAVIDECWAASKRLFKPLREERR